MNPTKVLVTFGSLKGGTEGIAHEIAKTLRTEGLEVDCVARLVTRAPR